MEIWLLLTVAGMVSSTPQSITVDETSNREVILEGSTVTLYCSLWPEPLVRCRVSWFYNRNGPFRAGRGNLSNQLTMTLTLHNVSQSDSGWYSCEAQMEIPILETKHSNWTKLEITSKKPREKPRFVWSDWWKWIALGASGLILVILLIVCLVLRKRQLNRKDLESQVYANMPRGSRQPSPQPRPSNNNTLKTESTYQNLRTPDVNKRYEHSRRLSPNR